ncbi:MAG: response regulator [Magnetococcales bacterium]|nr:CHASE domain-containing protein [Magnetococcales bacterium]NGZ25691.1 response regulator [Magnetococcales bacterium]
MKRFFSTITLPWYVFGLGVALVVMFWHHQLEVNTSFGSLRFTQKAEKLQAVAEKRMASYEGILRAAQGLFGATRFVSQEQWSSFVDALALGNHFPGIDWLAFVSPVLREERNWFEEKVLQPLNGSYRIRPQQERDEYFIITYIMPKEQEIYQPGYDLGSEQNRRLTAERARDTGQATLSRLYFQPGSVGTVPGLLHLMAVFRQGAPLENQEQRQDALLGWIAAAYRLDQLFADLFEGGGGDVRVEVFDGLMFRPDAKVYDSNPQLADNVPDEPWQRTVWLTVGGGKWTVRFSATPNLLENYLSDSLVYFTISGVFLSLALALSVWALIFSRQKALALAAKMTRASQESEVRFQKAVEWAPNPVMIHESSGRVIMVNRRWCELSRMPPAAITTLDHWLNQCCQEEGTPLARQVLAPPFDQENQVQEGTLVIHPGSDKPRVWYARSRLLGNLPDSRQIIISMAMDITELKHSETALRQAKIEAESANRAKSDFLATMSHEIRTPMNAIIGLAEVLSDSCPEPEQKEYLTVIRRSGDHLLELINDILDLSKVEAGRLELAPEIFNLNDLLERLIPLLEVRCQEKGLYLRLDQQEGVPLWVEGDARRLRQVLTNLIGNAIKFTHQGGVTVSVQPHQQEQLLFQVVDTGIGIPEHALGKIFEAFTQVDPSTTRQYGGTGLGLTISHRLVESMGGTLGVKSRLGEGSTFFFTARLPTAPAPEEKSPLGDTNLSDLHVLVVDDNPDSRLVLAGIIGSLGGHSQLVASIPEAEASLRQAKDAGQSIDLLLMAINRGGHGWLDKLEELRHQDGMTALPAVVVSHVHDEGVLLRGRTQGIVMLLHPLKKEDLKTAIQQAMANQTPSPVPPSTAQAMKILLVDDSDDNALLIRAFLTKAGHQLTVVTDGLQGVEQVQSQSFDLVLMDVQMPVMDGYTATRTIRQWEKEHNRSPIPILALTAHAFPEDLQRSLEAGCNGHLSKPIGKTRLLTEISRLQAPATPA